MSTTRVLPDDAMVLLEPVQRPGILVGVFFDASALTVGPLADEREGFGSARRHPPVLAPGTGSCFPAAMAGSGPFYQAPKGFEQLPRARD
jgi:hypothetical protein